MFSDVYRTVMVFGKKFSSDIIPHLCEHRTEKKNYTFKQLWKKSPLPYKEYVLKNWNFSQKFFGFIDCINFSWVNGFTKLEIIHDIQYEKGYFYHYKHFLQILHFEIKFNKTLHVIWVLVNLYKFIWFYVIGLNQFLSLISLFHRIQSHFFKKIWCLYLFHRIQNWKTYVHECLFN